MIEMYRNAPILTLAFVPNQIIAAFVITELLNSPKFNNGIAYLNKSSETPVSF